MRFIGWEYLKLVVKCPSFPSPKAAKVLHGNGWGLPTKSRANEPISKVLEPWALQALYRFPAAAAQHIYKNT